MITVEFVLQVLHLSTCHITLTIDSYTLSPGPAVHACKVCLHTIIFTLDQILYFIEFICLTFPNLVQLQLGAYSLIIEVRWSTL